MTEGRITRDDLAWWLEFAATREWTFAKTYAESAPHHYVVEGRTPGVTHEDMVRAARVIHTFGSPGKYYSLTKIYLVSPDGHVPLVDRGQPLHRHHPGEPATTELLYGIQNAPSTSAASRRRTTRSRPHGTSTTPSRGRVRRASSAYSPDARASTRRTSSTSAAAPVASSTSASSRRSATPASTPARRCSTCSFASTRKSQPCTRSTFGRHSPPARSHRASSTGSFLDAAVELSEQQRTSAHRIARLAVVTHQGGNWESHMG